jgi:hypothetical protein
MLGMRDDLCRREIAGPNDRAIWSAGELLQMLAKLAPRRRRPSLTRSSFARSTLLPSSMIEPTHFHATCPPASGRVERAGTLRHAIDDAPDQRRG